MSADQEKIDGCDKYPRMIWSRHAMISIYVYFIYLVIMFSNGLFLHLRFGYNEIEHLGDSVLFHDCLKVMLKLIDEKQNQQTYCLFIDSIIYNVSMTYFERWNFFVFVRNEFFRKKKCFCLYSYFLFSLLFLQTA